MTTIDDILYIIKDQLELLNYICEIDEEAKVIYIDYNFNFYTDRNVCSFLYIDNLLSLIDFKHNVSISINCDTINNIINYANKLKMDRMLTYF